MVKLTYQRDLITTNWHCFHYFDVLKLPRTRAEYIKWCHPLPWNEILPNLTWLLTHLYLRFHHSILRKNSFKINQKRWFWLTTLIAWSYVEIMVQKIKLVISTDKNLIIKIKNVPALPSIKQWHQEKTNRIFFSKHK